MTKGLWFWNDMSLGLYDAWNMIIARKNKSHLLKILMAPFLLVYCKNTNYDEKIIVESENAVCFYHKSSTNI